jgi:hypothetical protein
LAIAPGASLTVTVVFGLELGMGDLALGFTEHRGDRTVVIAGPA